MRIGAVAAGFSLLCGATSVWAQGNRREAAPPVAVTISVDSNATLRVVEADTERAITTCRGACSFAAPPGSYTLYRLDPETGVEEELRMRLRHATNFSLEDGSASTKQTGRLLGIGGLVLIGAGALLLMPAVLSSMCEDSNCASPGARTAAVIGVGGLVVGGIATPIGWTMARHGRTRLIDESTDEESASTNRFRLRVGFSAAPGTYGVGAVGTF
ncbi:MAG TPA: hypothetical protein VHB79_32255 [Polyangiaceae bacterium]|nr:hypothetical protein [Polyangiaceae bacterium]